MRRAAALGLRLGVTALVVGLTIVAFGTSTPELLVSLRAALTDNGGITLGNVVGSNIANIGLILGLAVLIRPLNVQAQLLRVDAPVMLLVSVLLALMLLDAHVFRWEGLLLLVGVVGYAVLTVLLARRERSAAVELEFAEGVPDPRGSVLRHVLLIAVGLGLLMGGAKALVRGAVAVAGHRGDGRRCGARHRVHGDLARPEPLGGALLLAGYGAYLAWLAQPPA